MFDGTVYRSHPGKLELYHEFNFKNFPYDIQ